MPEPLAWFAPGLLARRPVEAAGDLAALDRGGFWSVVLTFEGQARLVRWDDVRPAPLPLPGQAWVGPTTTAWRSSLDHDAYRAGVAEVRRRIREGDVYQANLCRVLAAALPHPPAADPLALAARLAAGNPAPHAAVVDDGQLAVVSASPELFLDRRGNRLASAPIKGTGATAADLRPKDAAENVMIVDLVRNDLQRVCVPGSVAVTALLRVEEHPGLVHLVSRVEGRLRAGARWVDVLAATAPPGSVSGAPKSSALRAIADLEPVPRGPYCGAVGWVDADAGRAVLAVGIRTFWWGRGEDVLRFGTGAGITWGSDPDGEWEETALKARRLVGLATREPHEGSCT